MRVTHRMIAGTVNRNLRRNLYELEKKSNRFHGPLFHPAVSGSVGTYKVMRISGTSLLRNEQFRRNIGEGITWLTVTEDALATALTRSAVKNGHLFFQWNIVPEDRETIAPEVKSFCSTWFPWGIQRWAVFYLRRTPDAEPAYN